MLHADMNLITSAYLILPVILLSINHLKPNELEEDAVTLESFPEYSLPVGEGVDFYYRRLQEEMECGTDFNTDAPRHASDSANHTSLQKSIMPMKN